MHECTNNFPVYGVLGNSECTKTRAVRPRLMKRSCSTNLSDAEMKMRHSSSGAGDAQGDPLLWAELDHTPPPSRAQGNGGRPGLSRPGRLRGVGALFLPPAPHPLAGGRGTRP